MPYMPCAKKEKGCERLVCGTLHLVYFDWQDGGGKKKTRQNCFFCLMGLGLGISSPSR